MMHVWCKFSDSNSNHDELACGQSQIFLEFLGKLDKMTLKIKVNDLYFQY